MAICDPSWPSPGEEVDRRAIKKTTRSFAVGPVVHQVDFALSFISPAVNIALFFLLALFYAIAPLPLFDRWLACVNEAETGTRRTTARWRPLRQATMIAIFRTRARR